MFPRSLPLAVEVENPRETMKFGSSRHPHQHFVL